MGSRTRLQQLPAVLQPNTAARACRVHKMLCSKLQRKCRWPELQAVSQQPHEPSGAASTEKQRQEQMGTLNVTPLRRAVTCNSPSVALNAAPCQKVIFPTFPVWDSFRWHWANTANIYAQMFLRTFHVINLDHFLPPFRFSSHDFILPDLFTIRVPTEVANCT